MPEKIIESPCVRSCCLDHNDVCIGCGRHLEEVKNWQACSNETKLAIIAKSAKRLEQRKLDFLAKKNR